MPSVNKVIVLGNLGRDPEVRTFPDGGTVCNIAIATTRRWKSRDSNDINEETEWHRVVFHSRLAEVAGEYLRKGHPVYIEGRLKTRKWQDKDGRDNYTTEIVAEQMQLLARREEGQQQQRQSSGGRNSYADAKDGKAPANKPRPSTNFDDMDDDIPF